MNINVYVPQELKEKIEAYGYAPWSKIACDAFRAFLESQSPKKDIELIEPRPIP